MWSYLLGAKTLGNKCSVRVRIFSWKKSCGSELPRRAQATSSLSNKERMTINLSERNKRSRQPRETPVAFPLALTMTDGLRAQTGKPPLFAQLESTPFADFRGRRRRCLFKILAHWTLEKVIMTLWHIGVALAPLCHFPSSLIYPIVWTRNCIFHQPLYSGNDHFNGFKMLCCFASLGPFPSR